MLSSFFASRGSWAEGGGRIVTSAVTSWDAAAGTVAISSALAAILGMCEGAGGGDLEVRGVEVHI